MQPAKDAERHKVVIGNDCRNACLYCEIGTVNTSFEFRLEGADLNELNRLRFGSDSQPALALTVGPGIAGATQVRAAAMPQGYEMAHDLPHAVRHVHEHCRYAAQSSVDQNE